MLFKIQLKFLLLLLCWGYKHVSCRHPYATRSLPPLLSSYLSLCVSTKTTLGGLHGLQFQQGDATRFGYGVCSRISFAVVVAVVCSLLLLLLLLCPHD